MKAAVLQSVDKLLWIEDVSPLQIGPGDVLIATFACGIRRTDLHVQDGLAYVPQLPQMPGHKPSGNIA
jgi:propanol-preferring alcohol dehydrogenase